MYVHIHLYTYVHWGTRCPMFAGDATFPGEVHWGTRCPMFAGDAVFPGEVHWGTRCPMFAGDAVFPSEVQWGTRCPKFSGDTIFPGEVHWGTDAQCLQGMPYSPVKFTADAHFLQGIQMPSPINYPATWYVVYYVYSHP